MVQDLTANFNLDLVSSDLYLHCLLQNTSRSCSQDIFRGVGGGVFNTTFAKTKNSL